MNNTNLKLSYTVQIVGLTVFMSHGDFTFSRTVKIVSQNLYSFFKARRLFGLQQLLIKVKKGERKSYI